MLNTLNGYINKLDNFGGASLRGVDVNEGVQFTQKSLEVAIQPGKASLEQWEQIGRALDNAKEKNINLKLNFIR